MSDGYEFGQAPEKKLTWSSLLVMTYRLYWKRFWAFFLAALPPFVLAYLFRNAAHSLTRRIVNRAWSPEFSILGMPPWLVVGVAITFVTGAVYWTISTLFFAAVADNVQRNNLEEHKPIADAYSKVRERIGALILVGFFTWVLFQGTRTIVGFCLTFLSMRIMPRSGTAADIILTVLFVAPSVLIAGLLSRLALAVPALMENRDMTVRQAIRNSVRRTDGWEVFFMLFLLKSAILGYAIFRLLEYGFHQLWAHTTIGASAYYWLTRAVYTCLAAMLESPLFIAFSVLHRELKVKPEEVVGSPAAIG